MNPEPSVVLRHPIFESVETSRDASFKVVRKYHHALTSGLVGYEIETGEQGKFDLPKTRFLVFWIHMTGTTLNQWHHPRTESHCVRPSEVSAFGPDIAIAGCWGGVHRSFCLGVADTVVEDIVGDSLPDGAFRSLYHFGIRDNQLCSALGALKTDFEMNAPVGPAFSEHIAHAAVLYALKRYCGTEPGPTIQSDKLSSSKLRTTDQFIDENLDVSLSLKALASNVNMSISRFCAQFKARTGLPPHQYMLRRRVERAKYLLTANQYSIAEVSAHTGFCDQSQFAATFKRFVGVTPGKYRNEVLS